MNNFVVYFDYFHPAPPATSRGIRNPSSSIVPSTSSTPSAPSAKTTISTQNASRPSSGRSIPPLRLPSRGGIPLACMHSAPLAQRAPASSSSSSVVPDAGMSGNIESKPSTQPSAQGSGMATAAVAPVAGAITATPAPILHTNANPSLPGGIMGRVRSANSTGGNRRTSQAQTIPSMLRLGLGSSGVQMAWQWGSEGGTAADRATKYSYNLARSRPF